MRKAARLVGEAAVPAAELRLFLKRLRRVLDWMLLAGACAGGLPCPA
ncbi:MAG: hypothetical protein HPM95_00365 [Alphaproteobacteria bacterium]|nr:hypothetical protein [Alphaproteobacteria bacterium]